MTTPGDLIALSLKNAGVLGVGQTALAEDTNDALTILNMMMAQWGRKRWLVYHLVETAVTSTGAQFYTVGPGGDFNVVRPDRLEAAFLRQLVNSTPNQVDYYLELIESYETYARIALKQLQSFPSYAFYDSGFPLGKVYPWPVMQSSIYSLHIITKEVISQFTSLAQVINLPSEYFAAILYNLSARLRPAYQLPPDPQLIMLAKDALAVIRASNAQIPRLVIPKDLCRPGIYNYFADTYY